MHKEFLSYHDGKTELEGYLARPSGTGPYPLVLIAHAWAGRDEFVCSKAEALAELGYAGFAIDMYGKGVRGRSVEENSKLIKPFLEDRNYLFGRIKSALTFSKGLPTINSHLTAAMGFCFGGLCVLDLARFGGEVKGVISLHGLLTRPESLLIKKIQAKILALQGHSDPMVPPAQVQIFQMEMDQAGADWQMHIYGHAMHAFTNPEANDPAFGTVYNQEADQRSWKATQNFLEEIFT